jgi:CRISPR-associated protein Cas5d
MGLQVKVWGELACFTRPEMHVERVSYPVMTPSAARGVLEAILWKPECTWFVREIRVLRPIQFVSLSRNELKDLQLARRALGWSRDGIGGYDASARRTLRHTLALREVAYVISADVVLRAAPGENAAKYRDQFRRRVERGQCFAQPYLGLREFVAFFGPPDGSETPVSRTEALGRMLLDLRFPPADSDRPAEPVFFDASLQEGVLRVPRAAYVAAGRDIG